jgi:hypothetical protein
VVVTLQRRGYRRGAAHVAMRGEGATGAQGHPLAKLLYELGQFPLWFCK